MLSRCHLVRCCTPTQAIAAYKSHIRREQLLIQATCIWGPRRIIANMRVNYYMHEVAASGPETRLHANRTLSVFKWYSWRTYSTACITRQGVKSHTSTMLTNYHCQIALIQECHLPFPSQVSTVLVLHEAFLLHPNNTIVYTACCPWLIFVTNWLVKLPCLLLGPASRQPTQTHHWTGGRDWHQVHECR